MLLLLLLLPQVYAQSCGELLTELRGFTSPALASYPDLSQVRQDTLLLLYSQERTSCTEELQGFASSALRFLKAMHEAETLTRAGDAASQREGIRIALNAEAYISEMRSYGAEFGILAQDAVLAAQEGRRSFLLSKALGYEAAAEKAKSTREKLTYYELAIMSYEGADAVEAKRLSVRRQSLAEKYSADLAEAGEYLGEARELLTTARSKEGRFLGFVDAYSAAREAKLNLARARELYALHNEEDKLKEVERVYREAEKVYSATRRRILTTFGALSAILTLLSVYIHSRILGWERDTYDCYLGNELVGA